MAYVNLKYYVEKYSLSAPELSGWMEENWPGGLVVFELSKLHRQRMRITNPLERLNKEINRRTKVMVILIGLLMLEGLNHVY